VNRWALTGRLPYVHKLPGESGAYLFSPVDVEKMRERGRFVKRRWFAASGWNGRTHLLSERTGNSVCVFGGGRFTGFVNGPTAQRPACRSCVNMSAFPAPYYVYTLDGADGILYVGCTINPWRRMQQHATQAYWADVVRTTLTPYDNDAAASHAELALIRLLRPPLNRSVVQPYPVLPEWAKQWRAGSLVKAAS
jgi:hypothetical protein